MSKPRSTIWNARTNTEDFHFDRVDREKNDLKRQIKEAEERLSRLLLENGEEGRKLLFFQEPRNHAQLRQKLERINYAIEQEKAKRERILSRAFQREHQRALVG